MIMSLRDQSAGEALIKDMGVATSHMLPHHALGYVQ